MDNMIRIDKDYIECAKKIKKLKKGVAKLDNMPYNKPMLTRTLSIKSQQRS